jgi:hypothetical protein
MRVSLFLKTIGAIALVFLAACGRPPVTARVSMFPPECELLPRPGDHTDSITVALLDAVQPDLAPWLGDAGERVLFHQLYETLITIDCLGDIQPGLAESWKKDDGGRQWTFALREEAKFWDGMPVTASDVAWIWQNGAPEPVTRYAGIDSITVAGDRVLHVYFKQRHRIVPRALSARAFTVAISYDDTRWPVGSGPYRISTSGGGPGSNSKRTFSAAAPPGDGRPIIRFLETDTYDARDLLEGVADVVVTDDPAVIEYAASRSQLTTIALPWDRTYVLLSTSRVAGLRGGSTLGTISSDFNEDLARDAVRSDARGYQHPSWWNELRNCTALTPTFASLSPLPRNSYMSSGSQRILYESDDPIARDLSERIVALASADPAVSSEAAEISSAVPGLNRDETRIVAEGVTKAEFAMSLRSGDDFAYVVSLPRRPADPCYEARKLLNRARWLVLLGNAFPDALIPLVDTRMHVIADEERVGLAVDWFGNLILNGRPWGDDSS